MSSAEATPSEVEHTTSVETRPASGASWAICTCGWSEVFAMRRLAEKAAAAHSDDSEVR